MAKFIDRNNNKEVEVIVNEIHGFDNDEYSGLRISWISPSLGFGNYDIYQEYQDGEIIPNFYADSERMDSRDDKAFLHALLEDLIEKIEVTG